LRHGSDDFGSMVRVLLVSGTARFDGNGIFVLNLTSGDRKPILVIEGVARIPTLSVTSLVVTDPNARYWDEKPSAQQVTFHNVPKTIRKRLRGKMIRVIVEVVEDEEK